MLERAVILASDSLYSDSLTRRPLPGLGLKVFPLTRNCAAVIAGHVKSARDALRETKRCMEQLDETLNWERFAAIVHDCFEVTPTEHIVECLIGICPLRGEPIILKMSSQSSIRFEPVIAQWHEEIGVGPDTRQAFCQLMEDRTRLGGVTPNSPSGMALRVVEALQSTIKTHPKYIGEPVQALIITREGLRITAAFDIAPADDITITRITPPQDWAPGPP